MPYWVGADQTAPIARNRVSSAGTAADTTAQPAVGTEDTRAACTRGVATSVPGAAAAVARVIRSAPPGSAGPRIAGRHQTRAVATTDSDLTPAVRSSFSSFPRRPESLGCNRSSGSAYPTSTATTPRRTSLIARLAVARSSGSGPALRTWSSRSSTCRHHRTKSPQTIQDHDPPSRQRPAPQPDHRCEPTGRWCWRSRRRVHDSGKAGAVARRRAAWPRAWQSASALL